MAMRCGSIRRVDCRQTEAKMLRDGSCTCQLAADFFWRRKGRNALTEHGKLRVRHSAVIDYNYARLVYLYLYYASNLTNLD